MLKEIKNDPRARRTRQLLQQAMNELMSEKRFPEITVQDITARAEVNRATFYAHFVDKYDLVNAIIRDHFQNALDANLPKEPALTRTNLVLLIETVYSYLSGFTSQCSAPHVDSDQGLMMRQVQTQLYTVLLEWLKRSAFHTKSATTTPEVAAMMTSWAIFGPALQSSWGSPKIPSQQLIDQLMPLVQSALKAYMQQDMVLSASG